MSKKEEKKVLSHEGWPGFKPVFVALVAVSVAYLAFILWMTL